MADGSVDIVIGTHRLLQTGVRWKDLGTVIVDEEQRFGVEHKGTHQGPAQPRRRAEPERHPDPRTLEMSLAGIREMSTILTPPEAFTRCSPTSARTTTSRVAAALRRELLRDGQVFYDAQPGADHRRGRRAGCRRWFRGQGGRRA